MPTIRPVRPWFALSSCSPPRAPAPAETLAGWLTAPADAPEIRARQQAIAGSRPRWISRAPGAGRRGRPDAVETDRLLEWAEMPLRPARAAMRTLGVHRRRRSAASRSWRSPGPGCRSAPCFCPRPRSSGGLKDQMNAIVSARDPESRRDFVADALDTPRPRPRRLADLLRSLESRAVRLSAAERAARAAPPARGSALAQDRAAAPPGGAARLRAQHHAFSLAVFLSG